MFEELFAHEKKRGALYVWAFIVWTHVTLLFDQFHFFIQTCSLNFLYKGPFLERYHGNVSWHRTVPVEMKMCWTLNRTKNVVTFAKMHTACTATQVWLQLSRRLWGVCSLLNSWKRFALFLSVIIADWLPVHFFFNYTISKSLVVASPFHPCHEIKRSAYMTRCRE